jgi:hypothetical protein
LWNVVSAGQYGKTYGATPTVTIQQYNSQLASSTYTFTDTDAAQHSWTVPNLGTNEYIVVTASAAQGGYGGSAIFGSGASEGAGGGGGGGSTALSNNSTYGSGTYNIFISGGGGGSGSSGGNNGGASGGGVGGFGGKISNASTTVTAGSLIYYTIGLVGNNGFNGGSSPGNGNTGGQGHVNGSSGTVGTYSYGGPGGNGATDSVTGGIGGAQQVPYGNTNAQPGNNGNNGTASAGGTLSAGTVGTSTGNGSITVVLYYMQSAENVSSTVSGNNFGGTVTVSAMTTHLSPTTSTINFAPWTIAPTGESCTATTWASNLSPYILAENTTSVEFGFGSTIAGNKYDYQCNAY